MILYIKEWCESLIIVIIISIIVEILIPDENNKKYLKIIIGIYIILLIIEPILELMKKDIDFSFLNKYKTKETSIEIDDNIKEMYILGIEEGIKKDLKDIGIIVKDVELKTDSYYSSIEKVNLTLDQIPQDLSTLYEYFYNNYSIKSEIINIRSYK